MNLVVNVRNWLMQFLEQDCLSLNAPRQRRQTGHVLCGLPNEPCPGAIRLAIAAAVKRGDAHVDTHGTIRLATTAKAMRRATAKGISQGPPTPMPAERLAYVLDLPLEAILPAAQRKTQRAMP